MCRKAIISVILGSEELVCAMLLWVNDNNPIEDQIMPWIVEYTWPPTVTRGCMRERTER